MNYNNPTQFNIKDGFEEQQRQKKVAHFLQITITSFFMFIGLAIVFAQTYPLLISYINGRILEKQFQNIATPLPNSYKQYIEGEFAYYDPGESYFENLLGNISSLDSTNDYKNSVSKNKSKHIKIDTTYNKPFTLSIPAIAINNIRVTPNVESYDEKVYNKFLKLGLAHFKGTPLPGDGGNSFIYGHSAVETFFSHHKNLPETIFSKLENAEIGQKIYIKKDGKMLTYTIRKKRIIDPNDFSFLKSQGNKETVTLMTCWPLGIGSKRLIVIAERNE